MKAWDVFDYDFPWGRHPAVIVSNDLRVQRKPDVVILKCSTQRATRQPVGLEALLDAEDGLDCATLVPCDVFFTVPKADLKNRRGSVTKERRRDIQRKIFAGFAQP
jgi:mRNA-degrading endonuclease toxin of MazEF toxin-antitoxin module